MPCSPSPDGQRLVEKVFDRGLYPWVLFVDLRRSQSGAEMEGQEAANIEAGGEDIMREMMGEFEKMGEKEASSRVYQDSGAVFVLEPLLPVACSAPD